MFIRKIVTGLLLLVAVTTYSQKNFSYSPDNPKPGDVITFTYEPAGDIANTIIPVEGVVYYFGDKGNRAEDLVMERKGNKYQGIIPADTSMNFILLGFSAKEKFDNNFNEGYFIQLYENGKPRSGSFVSKSNLYQYFGGRVGVERNNDKALASMEEEFNAFPENKKKYLLSYVRLLTTVKKDQTPQIVQAEIEKILKAGLSEEADYENLISLYNVAKLTEQSKFFANLQKEKFPDGKWVVNEKISKFYAEKDVAKKKQHLAEIEAAVESGDIRWVHLKESLPSYRTQIVYQLMRDKKWEEFKIAAFEITDKSQQAAVFNNAAGEMQKSNDHLSLAEEFSLQATQIIKEEISKPTSKRPPYLTAKQWVKQNQFYQALYTDTYAMVLYRLGQYKKGFVYAKEAAIVKTKGENINLNNTYALLAEKVLPAKKLQPELEQFVKKGKSTSEMKDILRRLYVKQKKSDAGFDEYIAALQKESYLEMIEHLRKSMLNEVAPQFALYNLDGNKIDIRDLKGKVVIIDFWATWCGPCKASFPGMQKVVEKYKSNPDVKFVFIDTWERGENKEKDAKDFITANKYTFDVLMDNEDKVVAEFKVEGIPTKFVIDKEGTIRFRSIGFNGSDDKLINELSAMIELAGDAKKAF